MPKVSVVIPTCNRPELLRRALSSVFAQTYQDFEVIVVDDGQKTRAEEVIKKFHDSRIRYVKNETSLGGGGSRNRGIAESGAEFVAFLDDDDEWVAEKLATQMEVLEKTTAEVGFCVSAVKNITGTDEYVTEVEEGLRDFYDISLTRFKGFLTSTLLVKRAVFLDVGMFDDTLPSHQEAELMIRISAKYKGVGISKPLARMDMTPHEHIGGSLERRIRGREMLLEKHKDRYSKFSDKLAKHYFWLALWCRDAGEMKKARDYFFRAFRLSWNPRYLAHAALAAYKKDFVCQ